MDGSDGSQYYWYDLRKPAEISMSRDIGERILMVRPVFSFSGQTSLCFISIRCNFRLLRDVLIKCGHNLKMGDFIFQKDKAPILRFKHTTEWFNIEIMD